MGKPYKKIEVYSYTETHYYDEFGNLETTERNYDDWWADTKADYEELTEDELADYFPYYEEDN